MQRKCFSWTWIPFLLLVLSLGACGPSNEIRLLAVAPPKVSTLPRPNAPTVTVVELKDKRSEEGAIGQRRDMSAFTTTDSPTNWISHAFADELSKHGLQVSYATNLDQARKGNPDYIISGKLTRLWLKETSTTNLETFIEVEFVLANREKRILVQPNRTQESRGGLPSSGAAEDLLRNTMIDVVESVAAKMAKQIWAHK